MKLVVRWYKGLPFKVADFIGLFIFEWYSQNKVGNIDIPVLWTDPEKLLCVVFFVFVIKFDWLPR